MATEDEFNQFKAMLDDPDMLIRWIGSKNARTGKEEMQGVWRRGMWYSCKLANRSPLGEYSIEVKGLKLRGGNVLVPIYNEHSWTFEVVVGEGLYATRQVPTFARATTYLIGNPDLLTMPEQYFEDHTDRVQRQMGEDAELRD